MNTIFSGPVNPVLFQKNTVNAIQGSKSQGWPQQQSTTANSPPASGFSQAAPRMTSGLQLLMPGTPLAAARKT
jgi:hypothetical protein